MKKNIKLIFLFAAIFLFINFKPAEADEIREIKIVTSFYPIYIIAKNVTRDIPHVSVKNLTSSFTGCLHDYALTSNDMKNFASAQLFVINGAGMESFLNKVTAQYPELKTIELSKGISLIKGNPHVWVSIQNAIIEVKNLGKALEEFDPEHKELYQKNVSDYAVKLEALQKKMTNELAPYKGRGIITFHEAFPYFAQEFGFNIVAVVEREPGSQPSAKELKDTIEIIRKNKVSVLFSEPQYSSSAADVISRETGVKVYVLDPAVTGPDDYAAYINIMENNFKVLKQAFKEKI